MLHGVSVLQRVILWKKYAILSLKNGTLEIFLVKCYQSSCMFVSRLRNDILLF